jgi:CheY-like chemotaxis protein
VNLPLAVLLIEDDEIKRQGVFNAISKEFEDADIVTSNSVKSSIEMLSSRQFDLVVADMSLPTFDIDTRERGGTPRPFGGIEVFEYLERMESTVPVLVVTSYPVLTDGKKSISFDGLRNELSRDFSSNFAGIIYFDSQYADWEQAIRQFLLERFGSSRA